MKTPPCLLSLLLVACEPAKASTSASAEVRCELLTLDASDDPAVAFFRASNGTGSSVFYSGYSDGGPLYQCEVFEAGVWQSSPLGWCGTGLEEHVLEPGDSLDFTAMVPTDGRRYRFSFGDPPVLTPPVSATPK